MHAAFLAFLFLAALGIAAGHLAEASSRPGSGGYAAAAAASAAASAEVTAPPR